MALDNPSLVYSHPHVGVYIEDNSILDEVSTNLAPVVLADDAVGIIQLGKFAKGRDNTILSFDSWAEAKEELGAPNYRLYGQAAYNIHAALSNNEGNCRVYAMRVMPTDATYSNVAIKVSYKWGTYQPAGSDEPEQTGLIIKYTAVNKASMQTKSMLKTLNDYQAPTEEVGGETTSALMAISALGRGKYGNNLRIKFSDITPYDNEPDYKTYQFDVLEHNSVLSRKETFTGTFNESAFNSALGQSLYIQDLINDEESGSKKVNIEICQQTIEDMINLYNANIGEGDEKITLDTFDFITGTDMSGGTAKIFIDPSSTISVSHIEGLSLAAGSDGAFDTVNGKTTEEVQTAYTSALIDAAKGNLDKRILSRYGTPATCILDAGFPDEVKQALVELATKRQENVMLYLDAGIEITTTDAYIAWLEKMQSYGGPNILKDGHHYKIRDLVFTGKQVPVTTTYVIARDLPRHIATYGYGVPFVMNHARVTDAVRGSFMPVVDPGDEEVKNAIYKLRGNYFETVTYGTYQRATALTSQKVVSDRSDEFNEYILHEGVKICTDLLRSKLYNFAEAEDRALYQTEAETLIQNKIGSLVRTVTVAYEMSAADELNNILRIKLRIVCKTVIKRGIVEAYIDPRASTSASTAQ